MSEVIEVSPQEVYALQEQQTKLVQELTLAKNTRKEGLRLLNHNQQAFQRLFHSLYPSAHGSSELDYQTLSPDEKKVRIQEFIEEYNQSETPLKKLQQEREIEIELLEKLKQLDQEIQDHGLKLIRNLEDALEQEQSLVNKYALRATSGETAFTEISRRSNLYLIVDQLETYARFSPQYRNDARQALDIFEHRRRQQQKMADFAQSLIPSFNKATEIFPNEFSDLLASLRNYNYYERHFETATDHLQIFKKIIRDFDETTQTLQPSRIEDNPWYQELVLDPNNTQTIQALIAAADANYDFIQKELAYNQIGDRLQQIRPDSSSSLKQTLKPINENLSTTGIFD